MSCNSCSKRLAVAEAITCGNCQKMFHPSPCSSLTESSWKGMGPKAKGEWNCSACRGIRTRADCIDDNDASTNKKYRAEDTYNIMALKKEFTAKMDEMSSKFQGMFEELKIIIKDTSLSHIALSKKIEELMTENKVKDKKLDMLEARVNTLEQQLLKNNAVIVNAPPLKPAIDVVLDIAKAADVNIVANDIVEAYRTKDNKKLVVKFANQKNKILLMKKVRE
ncbi:hypothetical protein PSTG_18273, partial [Puccinia striiformis f. sp. tritici PST-78]